MEDSAWRLDQIGSFIYLLDCYGSDEKNILQRRFKKDGSSLDVLLNQLTAFERLGFDDAMTFGRGNRQIKRLENNKHLPLIEIRVTGTLWRVVTYVDYDKKVFVVIDAFENHKKKTVGKVVEECEGRVRKTMKLLRKVE